ncbi:hypothetical protein KDK_76710 [Dictyobacter kobayashii]|uniref:Uncharacterized protein n=1 Tax=Dictyobacter kobayashii TaxID=2014872 RepID=A0A402AXL6_9CHLR|nr:hypothetical protein KDK_76710 [Dictyobacter kobayashii]
MVLFALIIYVILMTYWEVTVKLPSHPFIELNLNQKQRFFSYSLDIIPAYLKWIAGIFTQ